MAELYSGESEGRNLSGYAKFGKLTDSPDINAEVEETGMYLPYYLHSKRLNNTEDQVPLKPVVLFRLDVFAPPQAVHIRTYLLKAMREMPWPRPL